MKKQKYDKEVVKLAKELNESPKAVEKWLKKQSRKTYSRPKRYKKSSTFFGLKF